MLKVAFLRKLGTGVTEGLITLSMHPEGIFDTSPKMLPLKILTFIHIHMD